MDSSRGGPRNTNFVASDGSLVLRFNKQTQRNRREASSGESPNPKIRFVDAECDVAPISTLHPSLRTRLLAFSFLFSLTILINIGYQELSRGQEAHRQCESRARSAILKRIDTLKAPGYRWTVKHNAQVQSLRFPSSASVCLFLPMFCVTTKGYLFLSSLWFVFSVQAIFTSQCVHKEAWCCQCLPNRLFLSVNTTTPWPLELNAHSLGAWIHASCWRNPICVNKAHSHLRPHAIDQTVTTGIVLGRYHECMQENETQT